MKTEVTIDTWLIEVTAWVEVDEDEIVIMDVHYDGQQVRVDKMHPELVRRIEDIAIDEWEAWGE